MKTRNVNVVSGLAVALGLMLWAASVVLAARGARRAGRIHCGRNLKRIVAAHPRRLLSGRKKKGRPPKRLAPVNQAVRVGGVIRGRVVARPTPAALPRPRLRHAGRLF